MPRLEHQKSKILVILDIMKRTVGEENALSTNELIDMLRREYDIPCDRRTLSDDIKLLQQYINENDEYLFTVNSVRVKKENRYYSLPKRETAEFSNDDLISLITAVNNLPLTDDIDDDVNGYQPVQSQQPVTATQTMQPAVPKFPGTKPYQQIPFQAQSGTLMTLVRCIFIL